MDLYRKRNLESIEATKMVFKELIKLISIEEQNDLYSIYSDDLFMEKNEENLNVLVQFLNILDWGKIKEISRIRIENLVENNLTGGLNLGKLISSSILKKFSNIEVIERILLYSLTGENSDEILEDYWDIVSEIKDGKFHKVFVGAVIENLKEGWSASHKLSQIFSLDKYDELWCIEFKEAYDESKEFPF